MKRRTSTVLAVLLGLCCVSQQSYHTSLIASSVPVQDSVVIAASTRYSNPSFFKKILLGNNYRRIWETPVKLPVFHLSQSGLKIKELGGGMQTKSLRLEDKRGVEWVLRTVDKEVTEEAVPEQYRNRLMLNITKDMVSAAHPYAPLVVAHLAKSVHVFAPNPTFYYVSEDKMFGEFAKHFVGKVCMLEEREPTPDRSETESTEKVLEEIDESGKNLIMQSQVLRARLLDMLVADWDRHADQWRWGVIDSGKVEYYYAIPRDRDQAFFDTKGLVPKFVRFVALPHLQGFTYNSNDLRKLNFKSYDFDRMFLNDLDATEWKSIIQQFQQDIPDVVIETAVKKMPPEIYALDGAEIAEKLKSRRDGLLKNAMNYYIFLSNHVNIIGTDDHEVFKVINAGENLKVTVTNTKNAQKVYERIFDKKDTKEISLIGLDGNDVFEVADGTASSIKINIIGNGGADTYNIKGNVSNLVIDSAKENNKLLNTSKSKIKMN